METSQICGWSLNMHYHTWLVGGCDVLPVGAHQQNAFSYKMCTWTAQTVEGIASCCIASHLLHSDLYRLWKCLGSPVQCPVLITKTTVNSSEIQERGLPMKISFCTVAKAQCRWLIRRGLCIPKPGGWQQGYSTPPMSLLFLLAHQQNSL